MKGITTKKFQAISRDSKKQYAEYGVQKLMFETRGEGESGCHPRKVFLEFFQGDFSPVYLPFSVAVRISFRHILSQVS